MNGVKYKYQLQFVNQDGEWQEFDSFQNKSEAQEVQTQYEVKHNTHLIKISVYLSFSNLVHSSLIL